MARFIATSFFLVLVLSLGGYAGEPLQGMDMKNPRTPAAGLVTGGQPSDADFQKLKKEGIKAVINLRPDAETAHMFTPEKQMAEAHGIRYFHLPISSAAGITETNAKLLDDMLKAAGGPTLVHCASGNRAGALLALRAFYVEGKTAEEALAFGKTAGLTGLEPAVRERLGLMQE